MIWKRGIGSKRASLVVVCFTIGCGGNVRTDAGTPPQGDRATGFGPEYPAQAALSFSSAPAPGMPCEETNPTLGFPSDANANVRAELNCDLSRGCKPDEYIEVDGKQGATVACTVSPRDVDFAVKLSLDVDGGATNEPSVHFELDGRVSDTGGIVSISESNSIAGGGGAQSDCKLSIASPFGLVASGKIWGQFECNVLRDVTKFGDTGCQVDGALLFESCGY